MAGLALALGLTMAAEPLEPVDELAELDEPDELVAAGWLAPEVVAAVVAVVPEPLGWKGLV
jgi:hypothetical protein